MPSGSVYGARCRLEAVLYSLTAVARELLHLRTPALADLHLACAAASLACAKPSPTAASAAAQVRRISRFVTSVFKHIF